ncbi:phage major capsid protein [Mesorhizobium sp. M0520]|uniref:phage major capsid protein n=1 Tax=Mesorhizobium sp. M0520 TaxID=2956957 RepID=UPI00333D45DD
MPEMKEVLEDVEKEVKKIGDNVTELKTSMEKDLKSVREYAEKVGKDAGDGTQLKKDLEALTAGVEAKHAAIEAQVKKIVEESIKGAGTRMDEFERKLNRARLMGGSALDGQDELKLARDFTKAAMASRGELKTSTDLSDDKIDLEGIKAYSEAFKRHLQVNVMNIPAEQQKAMSVGTDPSGGYQVSPTVMSRMLAVQYESSPMRQLASVENIGSDVAEFPIDDDEAGSGWVGENEDRDETDTPEGGVQRIPVHEIYAMPRVSARLLEDADFDVEGFLARKVGERFGRQEATAFVAGNTPRRPRGFLTYPAGTTRGKIEQIVSGAATDMTWDALINLMSSLKDFYVSGAVWVMRRATVGNLMLKKDGDGRYIWQPNQQAGKPSILIGHEVYNAADMPAVGAGALPIAFGNFKAGYTIIDRRGSVTLRDPYTKKGSVKFYTTKRVGGDVTEFEAIKLMKIAAS